MSANAIQFKSEHEILVNGDIGYDWESSEKSFIARLDECKGKPVTVGINTFGGSNKAALGMYHAMKRHGDVTTRNDGYAVSNGSLLMLGGVKRISPVGSRWMVHEPWASGAAGNAAQLRKMAEDIEGEADAYAEIYASETKLTKEGARDMMKAETWFGSDRAKELGFATDTEGAVTLNCLIPPGLYRNAPQELLSAAGKADTPATSPAAPLSPGPAGAGKPNQPAEGNTDGKPKVTRMEKTMSALAELKLIPSAKLSDEEAAPILKASYSTMAETIKSKDAEIASLKSQIEAHAKTEAEAAIDAAIAAKKVAPEAKAAWVGSYLKDIEGTKAMLAGLAGHQGAKPAKPLDVGDEDAAEAAIRSQLAKETNPVERYRLAKKLTSPGK